MGEGSGKVEYCFYNDNVVRKHLSDFQSENAAFMFILDRASHKLHAKGRVHGNPRKYVITMDMIFIYARSHLINHDVCHGKQQISCLWTVDVIRSRFLGTGGGKLFDPKG